MNEEEFVKGQKSPDNSGGQKPKKKVSETSLKNLKSAPKWVKGQSGNPAGKPVGIRHRSTIMREWLECRATDKEGGTKADQVTRALIAKAETGDIQAYNAVMDAAYGKIPEVHEFSGIGGAPIKTETTGAQVTIPAKPTTLAEATRAYQDLLKKAAIE